MCGWVCVAGGQNGTDLYDDDDACACDKFSWPRAVPKKVRVIYELTMGLSLLRIG